YIQVQHQEEEKRTLTHEIILLNNHLMEAKMTIDKLADDNELYRKDCNLAAQLLQCTKSHHRAHKLSELPTEFQERVSVHMEKHGCGPSLSLCHSSYADSVPTCVIAKVLEKPEPSSLSSSHLSSPMSRGGSFMHSTLGNVETFARRPSFKSDIYCSDTALYCPEEKRRERRPSIDIHIRNTELFRAQNSAESTAEEGFHSGFLHEAFSEYAPSLPASSSYSSFSVASDEKSNMQSSIPSSHQTVYMSGRDDIYERKTDIPYEHQISSGFVKSKSVQHMAPSHQNGSSPHYTRAFPVFQNEPLHFTRMGTQHVFGSPKLPSESRSTHILEDDLGGRWRQLSVDDIHFGSYRNSGRLSPCTFTEQHFASPMKQMDKRLSPVYTSYKSDSFPEGEDACQSLLLDTCFRTASSSLDSEFNTSCAQEEMPIYSPKEQKSERIAIQMCGKNVETSSNLKKEYVDISPNSSVESLNQSPMGVSNVHHFSVEYETHSVFKPPQLQKMGSIGLSRKDSLTKAQLYGTLLN
uniref:Brain enriched guanylate kinase associated n=1 Tax=Latimeria chalumnae TaxID=7897 RepID=H3AAX0_LATCH